MLGEKDYPMSFLGGGAPKAPPQPTQQDLLATRLKEKVKQHSLLQQGILMRRSTTTTDTIARQNQPRSGLFIP